MAGAGKSYFVMLMALRNLLAGVDFLVVDPENEYGGVCRAADGQFIRLASSSSHRLNPFDLPPEETATTDAVDVLAEQVTAVVGLLNVMLGERGSSLSPYERSILDRAAYQTYAAVGITPDPATHARPVPILADLQSALGSLDNDVATGLAVRLHRY